MTYKFTSFTSFNDQFYSTFEPLLNSFLKIYLTIIFREMSNLSAKNDYDVFTFRFRQLYIPSLLSVVVYCTRGHDIPTYIIWFYFFLIHKMGTYLLNLKFLRTHILFYMRSAIAVMNYYLFNGSDVLKINIQIFPDMVIMWPDTRQTFKNWTVRVKTVQVVSLCFIIDISPKLCFYWNECINFCYSGFCFILAIIA